MTSKTPKIHSYLLPVEIKEWTNWVWIDSLYLIWSIQKLLTGTQKSLLELALVPVWFNVDANIVIEGDSQNLYQREHIFIRFWSLCSEAQRRTRGEFHHWWGHYDNSLQPIHSTDSPTLSEGIFLFSMQLELMNISFQVAWARGCKFEGIPWMHDLLDHHSWAVGCAWSHIKVCMHVCETFSLSSFI